MRNPLLIPILLILPCVSMLAQQSPIYSQYVLNEFIINPSVAGIDGMTTVNFSGRKQWLGREYTPSTYTASVSTRLLKTSNAVLNRMYGPNLYKKGASGRVGIGASLLEDRNGAINRTGLNLTYSYHIFILNSQLSFGLSFLAQQFKIDRELAQFAVDPGGSIDPTEGLIGKSAYIPDAAFGLNFSNNSYSLGFSAFQLFQSPVKFGDIEADFKQLKQVRQYTVLCSYNNTLNGKPEWEYEPAVIVRATERFQPVADISIRFIYKREYWTGLSLRTSGDFILLTGLRINRMYFGYSFDYGFNEISRQTFGSHEITMAVKFGDSTRRYRYWERY
ncbi:MAG: PorP/SprF family type IX secretion system membrane protein [Bacteroidales bacterium]|nr:PorP/SprF family type IX secretion system membrane protein [Bacteroidales bacterium]